MNTYELNQHDLRNDGRIILYQRPRSDGSANPFWWVRISVPNSTGYHRASTKRKNKSEAERYAWNRYEELYMRVLNGSKLNAKSFAQLFVEWKQDYLETTPGRNPANVKITIDRLGKYPYQFFVKEKKNIKVEDITTELIREYWKWRLNNSFRPNGKKFSPHTSTLKKEETILRHFLEHGKRRNFLNEIPEFPLYDSF